MEMPQRRSIIMGNPALRPVSATVSTLFAAYRINSPHEMMPPHRHSPNAIRFGLTGNTNCTSVNGEHITFGQGDLVLTPHDTWHNHGNGPENASVNLSVLDMPLVNMLNATYFQFDYRELEGETLVAKKVQSARVPEGYSQQCYGTGGLLPRFVDHRRGAGTSSPMFAYRWESTEKMLRQIHDHEGSPYEGIIVEYVDPVTGGPVYKTMTFCIPGGHWYTHSNPTSEDAVLFVSSDEPALRKLGFALKHGRDSNGDPVVLESSTHSARL